MFTWGRWNYDVDLSIGLVRVYVGADPKKYINFYKPSLLPLSYKLEGESIEIFEEKGAFRWSFWIREDGFSIEVTLRENYGGSSVLRVGMDLHGVQRVEKTLLDGRRVVGRIPYPYTYNPSARKRGALDINETEVFFGTSLLSFSLPVKVVFPVMSPSLGYFSVFPREYMRYLYRARQMLINKLNGLIGKPEYKDFHNEKFMPMLRNIHAEMAKLNETSTVGVAPKVDPTDDKNSIVINAYTAEKETLRASETYDTEILADNPDIKVKK